MMYKVYYNLDGWDCVEEYTTQTELDYETEINFEFLERYPWQKLKIQHIEPIEYMNEEEYYEYEIENRLDMAY